jgi:hypothetical protein
LAAAWLRNLARSEALRRRDSTVQPPAYKFLQRYRESERARESRTRSLIPTHKVNAPSRSLHRNRPAQFGSTPRFERTSDRERIGTLRLDLIWLGHDR